MEQLQKKVILITGGGSGVGLATAQRFLQEGARVAISGRDEAKLNAAIKQLNTPADRLLSVPTDVTSVEQVTKMVETVNKTFGPIDILVNNAGANLKARRMRELTHENWHQLMKTNLDGAFYCMKAVLPQMLERKDGVIININSVSGKRAYPLAGAAYAASKFGLSALAACLANEELESGIRVCSIYPGEIDTPILNERPRPVTPEHRAKILKPEDVAHAVLFVATLPPSVSIPELIIKPTFQSFF